MNKIFVLGLLTLCSSAACKNFISIPLVKHVDATGARILQEALSNITALNHSSRATPLAYKFKDDKYLQHYGKIEIGNPPQKFKMAFNTVNSLVVVTSNKFRLKCITHHHRAYDEHSSHTFKEVGESIALNNGSLGIKMIKDTFHIGKMNITDQYFGLVINGTCEDVMYDGIVGLGFSANYLSLLDNLLKQQESLKDGVVGLYIDRNFKTTSGGEVDLGYWNPKFVADPDSVEYIPIVNKINPAWAIKVKMAFIGDQQISFDRYAVIDLGSYYIDIPYYEAQHVAAKTGAYNYKGNLIVKCDKVKNMPNFTVHIGESIFTLEGKDYVDTSNSYQGYCNVLIRSSDENIWSLGGAFVGKYYTIFHYETKQIAFAKLIAPSSGSSVYMGTWQVSLFVLSSLLVKFST